MVDTSGSKSGLAARNANPNLARLRSYQPGPTAAEIARTYNLPESALCKLSSNEAPLGPSPRAIEAIEQAARSGELHRYPSSTVPRLRKAVAEFHGFSPKQVLPSAGSTQPWDLVLRALSQPGDELLWTEPSYVSFEALALINHRTPVMLKLVDPFDVTVDAVLSHVTERTRFIFLSSPNGTTSRLVVLDTIRAIAAGAPDALVVVDEHFVEAATEYPAVSAVNLVNHVENVLVTRTFSKLYGLAGLRVGYAVGDPDVIALLMQVKPNWPVSIVAEEAALAALADQEHLERNRQAAIQGRATLQRGLAAWPELVIVPHAEGNYLLARCVSKGMPPEQLVDLLAREGVMIRGGLIEGYVRIAVGRPEENERLLQALGRVLGAAVGAR
jgi:histidinol-phosphate aminotransferase